MSMTVAREVPPDAARKRQANGAGTANLPKRRTRNGKARLLTLDALDARTAAYAAAIKLIHTLSSDLGGAYQLTESERQLIARAALVGAITADFEARWVAGEEIALADYLMACRTQCRLLALLGLQRRPRDVSPTLSDIAAEIEASKREGDDT